MTTRIPARRQSATASLTSGRGGSQSATRPRRVSSRSTAEAPAPRTSSARRRRATARMRRPSAASRSWSARTARRTSSLSGIVRPSQRIGLAEGQRLPRRPLDVRGGARVRRADERHPLAKGVERVRNEQLVGCPELLGIDAESSARGHQRDLGGIAALGRGLRGERRRLEQLAETGRTLGAQRIGGERAPPDPHTSGRHAVLR